MTKKVKREPAQRVVLISDRNKYRFDGNPYQTNWKESEPLMRVVSAVLFVGLIYLLAKAAGF